MDSMDKILRIAGGAQPLEAEMSPAERIMQYAAPQAKQQPQDNSAWGRFKNFAGSNAGRTLWGGLGTALGVGLTGGSLKDALGYGVMGAGNTVGVLNRNKQYANQLALKQQERLDAIGKEQRENQFKLALQDQALAKSKQLADYQLDKTLERLRGENTINQENEAAERQRKINAINSNPFLDENEKQWQIAQLDSGSFNHDAYYTDKLSRAPNDPEALDYFNNQGIVNNLIKPANYTETVLKNADKFTPESFGSFSKSGDITQLVPNQKFSSGDLGLVQLMVSDGIPLVDALDRVGKMTPEQKINYEGKKAGAIKEGELPYVLAAQDNKSQNDLGNNITMAGVNNGYDQQQMLFEDKLKRGFEEFKTTLPVESVLNAHQEAQALQAQGYNVTAGDILYNSYRKDRLANQNTSAGIGKTRAETQKINTEIEHPKADYNSVDSVRKEFNALTSDYRKVGDAFARIKASYENPTPAGDLSMVFNYMKALDPGSVVRESEFENAENARAWFDKTGTPTVVRLAYEKAVNGGRLTPQQRTDFFNMAVKLYEAQKNSFDKQFDFYKELARRRGWNEDDIVSNFYDFKGTDSTNDDVIDYTDFLKGD